jgi:membrane-bound ClpP family serine protease
MDYLVHGALGVYGKTFHIGGFHGSDGDWFAYYDVFESTVRELMIASVLFGIFVGSLGMFGILRIRNKKSEDRSEVEIPEL